MPFFTSKIIVNKKRDRAEIADLYGIPTEESELSTPMTFDANNLTHEQIEGMRAVIAQHDKNAQPNVFDLSKPPVKPYVYQKFPLLVYNHKKCRAAYQKESKTAMGEPRLDYIPAHFATKTVNSEEELQAALAAGYEAKPPVFHVEEEDVDHEALQAQKYTPEEVARIDDDVVDGVTETAPARKRR